MELPVEDYLGALDVTLVGRLVRGVYLTGSAALDDWLPNRSDLDFLVVLDRSLTDAEFDALAEMLAGFDGKPYCDGCYVPADLLGERTEVAVPYAVDGELKREGHATDPVLWATLDRHGITLRGPVASGLGVAPDPGWLREWNLGNLESYWRGHLTYRRLLAERDPESPIPSEIAVWEITGPGRLHATIATGAIISKTASADYTASLFPEYADLCAKAKAWRLGDESIAFTAADGLRILDLLEAVCDDAESL